MEMYNDEDAKAYLLSQGIYVDDIQSLVKDQNAFARRVLPTCLRVDDYIGYCAQTIELGNGDFVNSYDLSFIIGKSRYKLKAASSPQNYFLTDHFMSPGALAAINGSFSFISDDPDYQPTEPCFDLCVRNGTVASLPTVTKPALLIINDHLVLKDINATGTLSIQGKVFSWIGSKETRLPPAENVFKVYSASNCIIVYISSSETIFKRIVNRETNKTPYEEDALDLLISQDMHGEMFIASIKQGGGTDLFQANLVLQTTRRAMHEFHVGEKVEIWSIDTFPTSAISSALSIGPSIYDAASRCEHVAWQFDRSLGNFPFDNVRYPRAIIYKTHDNAIHFRIFDGAPMTNHFKGVTPLELVEIMAQERIEVEWAYHLDGGQSSKTIFRYKNRLEIKGSLHYTIWPTETNKFFLWNGINGRALASSILLYKE